MNPPQQARLAQASDWPTMRQMFLAGIATGNTSFETPNTVPQHWEDFIQHKHRETLLVIPGNDEQPIAWGGLAPTSHRQCYRGVAEVQLYIAAEHQGQGLGQQMLNSLIDKAKALDFWTLQAVVFPENEASVRLFSSRGFRRVGYREKIAKMNGEWRDTLLFELRLPIE